MFKHVQITKTRLRFMGKFDLHGLSIVNGLVQLSPKRKTIQKTIWLSIFNRFETMMFILGTVNKYKHISLLVSRNGRTIFIRIQVFFLTRGNPCFSHTNERICQEIFRLDLVTWMVSRSSSYVAFF